MSGYMLQAIADQFMPRPPKRLGVAVSGGGDSVALLHLLVEFARGQDIDLNVITIEHGLREAAKDEVRAVGALCADLGVTHHVEYWRNWDGTGNLMGAARDARYGLIADWAFANQIKDVALGHTANDQAETLLMRLARGSGVDGLAAMSTRRISQGVVWHRPLLGIHRRDLRYYLQDQRVGWIDDPTNEDRDFERVRMREALKLLEPLGLTIEKLCDVAQNMTKAREALDWQTFLSAREIAQVSHGALALDVRRFRTLPDEVARRVVLRALSWLSGSDYPPRRAPVQAALQALRDGRGFTLDGCQITREGDLAWIYREYQAIRDTVCEVGDLWDDRWMVTGPEDDPEFEVRALGTEGLSDLPGHHDIDVPRGVLAATPAIWVGDSLIAAPLVESTEGWAAQLEGGEDAFYAALLSH